MKPFASDEFLRQDAKQTLKLILDVLRDNRDLADQLRVILKSEAAASIEPPAAPPADQVTAIIELPIPPPAEPVPSIMDTAYIADPQSLRQPHAAEERDNYINDAVKPGGWDLGTWASAVMEVQMWTWPDDVVTKLKKWAAELLEVTIPEGGAGDQAATAA